MAREGDGFWMACDPAVYYDYRVAFWRPEMRCKVTLVPTRGPAMEFELTFDGRSRWPDVVTYRETLYSIGSSTSDSASYYERVPHEIPLGTPYNLAKSKTLPPRRGSCD